MAFAGGGAKFGVPLRGSQTAMPDQIRYDLLTQKALRGVVRTVLTDAAKKGLPGDHHFYIGFDTHAPGRAAVRAAAHAISGADDHHPAAPVLGPERHRPGFRGRAVVRRHSGEAQRALRGDQQFLRSVRAVRPAVRGRRRRPGQFRRRQRRQAGREEAAADRTPHVPAAPQTASASPAIAAEPEAKPAKPAGGGEVVRLDRFRKK